MAVFVGVCSVHTLQWIASVRQPGIHRTRTAEHCSDENIGMTVLPSKLAAPVGNAPTITGSRPDP